MSMPKSLQELSVKIRELEDNFDAINYGGCACVATMLAKQLRNTYPVMRLTSCHSDWSAAPAGDIDEIRKCLNNNMSLDEWYDNGITFNHVWLEIFVDDCWYALDSTGVHTVENMYSLWKTPAAGSFTIDEMEALSEDTSWNPRFNRNQLPNMQAMISATIN